MVRGAYGARMVRGAYGKGLVCWGQVTWVYMLRPDDSATRCRPCNGGAYYVTGVRADHVRGVRMLRRWEMLNAKPKLKPNPLPMHQGPRMLRLWDALEDMMAWACADVLTFEAGQIIYDPEVRARTRTLRTRTLHTRSVTRGE